MLTDLEKILFVLFLAASLYTAYRLAGQILRIVRRGPGRLATDNLPRRAANALAVLITQRTVLKRRRLPSLAHAFIVWGFVAYLLGNLGNVLRGLIPHYVFLGDSIFGNVVRFSVDVLSVALLISMSGLLLRRAVVGERVFGFLDNTLLHPQARAGIKRDSVIVGAFILTHVSSHLLGESLHLVKSGPDPWQPFASLVSRGLTGLSPMLVTIFEHIFFWGAVGTVLLLSWYFPYSKHLHIFLAPLNFMVKPKRASIGQLEKINMEDESITQFGAARLEHLSQPQLLDAFACIMCNRCQEVCPAHATGKALSPSALEINKRYRLMREGAALAAGQESQARLLDFAISAPAVWACTTCGACVEVCPVNNEPMRDIVDIRRNLVLMENNFPAQLQQAFRGMERTGNPWTLAPETRLDWARGLNVPTVEQNPTPDVLWWVGCAPASDPRAQKTAQAFAKILQAAGVNYAVLGRLERCTGDSARRAGNEALFYELATANVETLNAVKPRRIVTTCPHCLHALANEYPALGGHYTVIHHTQFIEELVAAGKLVLDRGQKTSVAFHDPCYLGRHNLVYDAPRKVLALAGAQAAELPRRRNNSFCCGAGGAQMWKEEEHGRERISANRFREAAATGQAVLAVGCPFCMIMLTDAATAAQSSMAVQDVAEIVASAL